MKTKNYIYFVLLLLYLFSACEDHKDHSDMNADFFLEAVFVDNDERLLNYDAVKNGEREPFFIEEFDDNVSQFPYPTGIYSDGEVSISNGKMTVDYFADSLIHSRVPPIEIDRSRNFEMETSLIICRNDSAWHTFYWFPNQETGNEYAMVYAHIQDSEDKKLETIFLRNVTDDWESLKGYDFNSKDFLDSNEFTILTIRKIGDKYAIFINHKLFYIINDKNFSYIPSIIIDESVTNIFDYFRIYYLP
jgi:hypothetical protein